MAGAAEGKTLITADIGAEIGDEHWTMDDDALGELCVEHLDRSSPTSGARYLGVGAPDAARLPGVPPSYEADRPGSSRAPASTGLMTIGRNGEFAHILMEDVYWRVLDRIRRLEESWSG